VASVVSTNPKVMHGTPCFAGTRVPVQSLFDHLKRGYTIDGFLEQFPSIKREQVDALLDDSSQQVQQHAMPQSR
jgi:uncharacterized protein (DUF433 family)